MGISLSEMRETMYKATIRQLQIAGSVALPCCFYSKRLVADFGDCIVVNYDLGIITVVDPEKFNLIVEMLYL